MFLLRGRHVGMALLPLALGCWCRAQEQVVIPLVPAANWRLASSENVSVSAVVGFGGDPVIEREYGVKSLELRQYQLETRRSEVLVEKTADATSAFGLLTYYRTEEHQPEKDLDLVLFGPSDAIMARGAAFIRVRAGAGASVSKDELRVLLIMIGGTRLSRDEASELPAPLPSTRLIPHTEKYMLGLEAARRVLPNFRTDLIGFTQGAEAQVGKYSTEMGQATVLVVSYPTPQIARVRFGAMESLLGINLAKDSGAIYGQRTGSVVILVLDNSHRAAAEKLMAQFQVTSNLSWNEPAPEAERFALDLVRMILTILFLVFAIAAFAVIGGVLVVLSRRVAKRYFPKSEWANPEGERLIRLNLRQE